MYLSLLILNPRSRQVQRELADRYQLHRTLLKAFPPTLPDGERVLFRLELAHNHPPQVMIQSQTMPDWHWLSEAGYLTQAAAVKEFNLVFQPGQRLAFRLLANPTIKKTLQQEGKAHKARLGLYKEADQFAWLARKLQASGADLVEARASTAQIERGTTYREKQRQEMQFVAVQFDGLLQVNDPDALVDAVKNGLGSGKGFGFGLLSLARV
jgi:CRISPR system Cascade subunit CasE